MLSKFDDYPIHQTPEPIAVPQSSDRNVYDRYWFNGYDKDGEFYFGIGLGFYPNLKIMDCGFSIARDGVQHAFHASRRAEGDPSDTSVGPFRIEIIEPMRKLRVLLESNETGIECDLTFIARTACIEEGRQTFRQAGRTIVDATRFAQMGRWSGFIKYDGQQLDVDASTVFGTKDRSWGLRPSGDPAPPGAPPTELPQFFFLWAPLQWDDCCTHYGMFEDETGHAWHQDGMIVPAYESADHISGVEDPGIEKMTALEHRIQYRPGTRHARSAEITMTTKSGTKHVIQLEPLMLFTMKGLGYHHPEWGHGRWKGELAMAGESWKTADLDPLALENLHIQQVMRARWGDRVGVGVFEQFAIGPHATSGFKAFTDGAP